MSAIPPLGLERTAESTDGPHVNWPFWHSVRSVTVLPFIVGLAVGASVAAFLMILIGPSRKVRAEGALPPDVEAKLLLGQDPEQPTIPPPPRVDHDQPYTPNELAELQRLGDQRKRKKR